MSTIRAPSPHHLILARVIWLAIYDYNLFFFFLGFVLFLWYLVANLTNLPQVTLTRVIHDVYN